MKKQISAFFESFLTLVVASNFALLNDPGVELDRRWMFVQASDHEFLTIRQRPRMTLIDTAISPDGHNLLISIHDHPSSPSISLPINPTADWLESHTEETIVTIWEQPTSAYSYTCFADQLKEFQQHIFDDEPIKLVMKSPQSPRIAGGSGSPEFLGRTATLNFPDLGPVLIASQASLRELNSRLRSEDRKLNKGHPLDEDITIERFRPNIIVRGDPDEPWAEDQWKTVRIHQQHHSDDDDEMDQREEGEEEDNDDNNNNTRSWWSTISSYLPSSLVGGPQSPPNTLTITITAHCLRCRVPNVPPEGPLAAVPHAKQPWETLMSYRRIDRGLKFKPAFGMLGAPCDQGRMRVGDTLEVVEVIGQGKWKGLEFVFNKGVLKKEDA